MADADDAPPEDYGIGASQVNEREDKAKNLAQGEVGGAAMKAKPGLEAGAKAGGQAAAGAERSLAGGVRQTAKVQHNNATSLAAGTAAAGVSIAGTAGEAGTVVTESAVHAASAAREAANTTVQAGTGAALAAGAVAAKGARAAARDGYRISAEASRASAALAAHGAAAGAAGAASAGMIFGQALARVRAAGMVAERQARAIFGNLPPPDLSAISAATGASLRAVAEAVPVVEMDLGTFSAGALSAGAAVGSLASHGARAAAAAGAAGARAAGAGLSKAAGAAGAAAGTAIASGAAVAGTAGMQAAGAVGDGLSVAGSAAYSAGSAAASAAAPVAGHIAAGASAAGSAVAGAAGSAAEAAAPVAGHIAAGASAAGSAVAGAAGSAVEAAAPVAGQAMDMAGDAASAVGSAAGSAAAAAAPVAGQVGSAVVSGASAAGGAIAGAAGALANSDAVRAGARGASAFLSAAKDTAGAAGAVAWDAAGQAYEVSREGLAVALAAAAGGAAFIWQELIKLEIFRDVYQALSLIFSTVAKAALDATTNLFNYIASLINFNWDFTFNINPIYIIGLVAVLAVIVVIAYLWMMCVATGLSGDTDEIKHGAEAKTWEELAEEKKRTIRAIKIIMTAALSIYLPVAKMVVQLLSCDPPLMGTIKGLFNDITCSYNAVTGVVESCDCSTWSLDTLFKGIAGVLLLVFVIGLPVVCYYLVQKNKPVGSDDDPTKRFVEIDGKDQLVEYTSAMYQHDLRSDPRQIYNPFLFLYEGYDRQFAFYKVIQMVFKFFLVLPAILLVRQGTLATSIALLVVLGLYAGLTYAAKPFINPQADQMDIAGRFTAFVTVGFALISSNDVAPDSSTVMGILINIVNAFNFLILLALLLYSLPPVKSFLKNMLGRFTFSDTIQDITGRADAIVPDWIVYDELRNRVWRPFFQSLLMQADPTIPDPADPEAVKAAKELTVEEKKLSVTRRLLAQRQIAASVGSSRVKAHWRSLTLPGLLDTFGFVQGSLEGVDVYFDGLPHDKHRDWSTGFGKMFVRPYPFTCVIVYDEGGDYTYVYGADPMPAVDPAPVNDTISSAVAATESAWGRKMTAFERLVYLNRDCPEVRRQAHVRRSLRAMAESGRQFPLYFTLRVTRTVTVTRTNSEGKSETRSESISVLLTFNTVIAQVGANTSKRYAAGFKAAIVGIDGSGSGTSSDGRVHHFTNQRENAPVDISAGYVVSGLLLTLFNTAEAKAAVADFLPVIDKQTAEYRRELYEARAKEEQALSNAFYQHVYDAFPLPRPVLEAYLMDFEQNPVMRAIPTDHAAGLDFLYTRVRLVTRHPVAAFWFLFFQDLWAENCTMKCFKDEEVRARWDPRFPDALCYCPMPREDLVKQLDDMKLHRARGLFDDALLDLLYAQIESRSSAVTNPVLSAGEGV